MTGQSDREFMDRAVQLARRGWFSADPNPRVGCVLVKSGEIVGEGWHEHAGGPHAERMAITRAGTNAAGATAYVTLEPCSHTGRTGPCADALIEARVARVICAGTDPNPVVDGTGVGRLRAAGVDVTVGVQEASAAALNPGYRSRMTRGRPLIRSKLAASLDGRTALANGESQWITGKAARRDVHSWRARSSAVLTGVGTVLADDPGLDARLPSPHPPIAQPARIVVDSSLRTPPTAGTLALPGAVLIFGCREVPESAKALREAGARVEMVRGQRHCDLAQVMARLGELQFNEVWVEAGARLNGALLEAGLIDELVIYLAPQVLGADARGMFAIEPLASLEGRIGLEYQDVCKVGGDLRIRACLAAS